MPRPKTSRKAAELSGQIRNHPGRFRDRHDPPKGDPIGAAPDWFSEAQKAAWAEFADAWPWVSGSDEAALTLLCIVRARVEDPVEETKASLLALYRQLLSDFGGTPTSRSRIAWEPESEEDPFAEFLS